MYVLTYILISMAILQWNCRGLRANFNDLGTLCKSYNPQAICLRETHLKQSDSMTMRHFTFYNAYSTDSERAKGGASILVRQGVIHSHISLRTKMQAVAVQLSLFRTITICSVYIPPSENLLVQDLEDLAHQLPTPFVILGDFNSHNPLWGSDSTNNKGKKLEDFIAQNDLSLFNDGSNTYLHPATGTYSSIDLTITDPTLLNDFQWSVHGDMCGSDHFPIVIQPTLPLPEEHNPRWKFSKADWDTSTHPSAQIN